jgi:hypothetical protein
MLDAWLVRSHAHKWTREEAKAAGRNERRTPSRPAGLTRETLPVSAARKRTEIGGVSMMPVRRKKITASRC